MMGSGAALDDRVDPEDHGLIPRICSGILERVEQVLCGIPPVKRKRGNDVRLKPQRHTLSWDFEPSSPFPRYYAWIATTKYLSCNVGSDDERSFQPLRTFQMEHEAVVRGTHPGTSTDSRNEQGYGTKELSQGQGGRPFLPPSTHNGTGLPRSDGRQDECTGRTDSTDDGGILSTENSSRPPPPGGQSAAAAASAPAGSPSPGADAGANAGDAAAANHTEFSVEVSYLEIYNETLRDLFNPTTPPAAGGGNGSGSGGASGDRGTSALGNSGGGYASHGSCLRLREDPM